MASKKPKKITFLGDGINTCKCCETPIGKTPMYNQVCSSECAKELLDYNKVTLKNTFVKSLALNTKNYSEVEEQLKKFANRFNYDLNIVKSKFNEKVEIIKNFGYQSLLEKKELVA